MQERGEDAGGRIVDRYVEEVARRVEVDALVHVHATPLRLDRPLGHGELTRGERHLERVVSSAVERHVEDELGVASLDRVARVEAHRLHLHRKEAGGRKRGKKERRRE